MRLRLWRRRAGCGRQDGQVRTGSMGVGGDFRAVEGADGVMVGCGFCHTAAVHGTAVTDRL